MYPAIRLAKEMLRYRNAPPLGVLDTHVTNLVCWPWDIDVFAEMNNGRTLTLYDLGRFAMFQRNGMIEVMKRNRWVGTIAGASVRYRRRVRMFHKVEMHSRIVGWDDRFTYAEQSMWREGECTSHALFRMAVTGRAGLVPTSKIEAAMGLTAPNPVLPDWVAAWIKAEGTRPWPPMSGNEQPLHEMVSPV